MPANAPAPCPICGAAASFAFRSQYAQVASCAQCGHLFATGRDPGTGVFHGHDEAALARAYEARDARLVARLCRDGVLAKGMRVLDVGAGSGHVALALRAHAGADVCCIEADAGAVARLRERGLRAEPRIEDCAPHDFGLAVMMEVLEHFDDPVAELRKVRGRLAPGGVLFLTTPCGRTRTGSTRTNAYDTPEHVQFFTERSLAAALARSGFGRLRFLFMDELYPAVSPVRGMLRHLRAALLGYRHLVGYARAGA